MNDIEISEYKEPGYKSLVITPDWRVAILNHTPHFEALKQVERHMESDETFVLLSGEVTLITAGASEIPGEILYTKMEINKIYNIKKAVWHHLFMSVDGSVLIVENADVGKENTEYAKV